MNVEGKTKTQLIDEIQQLQERLEVYERMLYFVGHELKHMSIDIFVHAKLLFRSYENDPEAPESVKAYRISLMARYLEQMIDGFVDFLSADKPKFTVEEFEFREIIEIVKTVNDHRFSEEVQLIVDNSALNATLVANKLEILEIMLNLIRNAFRHGGENMTLIRIGYRKTRKFDFISVYNNGRGIKEEDCEKIFDMFERGDGLSKDSIGLGVGLAVVKEMCKRHQGSASCKTGKKRGVTFIVKLSRSL